MFPPDYNITNGMEGVLFLSCHLHIFTFNCTLLVLYLFYLFFLYKHINCCFLFVYTVLRPCKKCYIKLMMKQESKHAHHGEDTVNNIVIYSESMHYTAQLKRLLFCLSLCAIKCCFIMYYSDLCYP